MDDANNCYSRESSPRTSLEIRNAFVNYFAEREHEVVNSASLIPEDPTVLLTIAGMLPFKPIFLGQVKAPSQRAVSVQKCIRTNDIENVGRTARHQTFFEMLGNFSFGNYFKEEAIRWAWELSTNVYKLDPQRLIISVFREDDEAASIWQDLIGVNPKKIIRMDEKDNFWASGPTGPCGPCSEMYYDFLPELGDDSIDLEDENRFIEFYNLVFMEFNRDNKGKLTPLKNRSIDTGMGLERMAQILQRVPNNYETDLIFPIIEKAARLASIDYLKVDVKTKTSLKIIGDHSRAITHLIADGVRASNLGRGYVLRRLLRRVVRHGRLIGINQTFLTQMGESVIELMSSIYPNLIENKVYILKELETEEERFLETLERGEKLLNSLLKSNPSKIKGEQAFELYDTYGFPLELTEEIASEYGVEVDLKGFNKAMNEQKKRAKAASISIDLTVQSSIEQIVKEIEPTTFKGYETLEERSQVKALIVNGKPSNIGVSGDEIQVILDSTPFYGESGGQVGDRGHLKGIIHDNDAVSIAINAVNTNKNVFVHNGFIEKGQLSVGDVVNGQVDRISRSRAQAHHTATHLLQAALKKVKGPDISQAGSLVDFNRLRFDFHAPNPVTSKELEEIEQLINLWINEAYPLEISQMSLENAKSAGAIAMFGEKYEDIVRVVNVPGVSLELCGGTHVKNTSEIGFLKILNETSVAAGIRRIEAIAGPAIMGFLNERDKIVKDLAERFKSQPNEIIDRVISLQEELKLTTKSLERSREELALTKAISFASNAIHINNSQLIIERLDGIDGTGLQGAAQGLVARLGKNSVVIFGGLPNPNDEKKVVLIAAFGETVISYGLQAGKFIGEVAKICGGGGGGRSNIAQAGGRDGSKLDHALKVAREKLITKLQ